MTRRLMCSVGLETERRSACPARMSSNIRQSQVGTSAACAMTALGSSEETERGAEVFHQPRRASGLNEWTGI